MLSMRHSAVLLAGGKSSRMGRNKAQIPFHGQPLWLRQMEVLRETAPQELLISAPRDAPYNGPAWRIVPDAEPDQGPLGGIATAFAAMSTEWLLVLAVDLPFMTADFLRDLIDEVNQTGKGAVPVHADGKLEPLVAIYPRAALPLAQEQLRRGERKLMRFIEELESAHRLGRRVLSAEEVPLFINWNVPADLAGEG
jgi:molybdopterin-guanine dinucleotide biosynthesis protein A